jgi:hypothetical protein
VAYRFCQFGGPGDLYGRRCRSDYSRLASRRDVGWRSMEASRSATCALVRHGSHGGAIHGIEVTLQLSADGVALFRFVLRADLSELRIPQPRAARRADDLWRHTCFETFIRAAGAMGYHEINFSPSLEWALYRFNSYREGMVAVDVGTPPEIVVRRFADRLELEATVHVDALAGLDKASRFQVGLSAVVEADDGTLSYWALTHPAQKPDFHRAEGFLVELDI